MKICFPARKANGEQYATLDDMMQPLCHEPHGSWLAGTNNMWHGGIHITRKSAPGSVLTKETAETAVPLQFMAGGEVVAWRINQDYLTGKYINNPLQYSGTFVLVKSTCTPDPEKKDNSLDFYSLYIGLAPLSAFPEHKLYQVTDKGDGLSQREYTGKEKDGDKAPVAKDKLKTGDSVIVLRELTFDLKGQTQTFGLARMLNSKSEMTGGAFWVSLDPQYMTPAGKQRAHLPAWMQQAVAQGTFDTVVKPATRMEVAAGDAVGYLAEDIAPCDLHGVEKSAFAHIEVISTDSRMVDFLSNKAQVKSGQKYVYIHPESFIYSRSGDTFTWSKGQVKKDIHKIMPQDKCHPFKDSSGKRWFDIGDGAWVSEDDIDADIDQYDLDKLGFKAFEEPSTSDMTKSLREGWIKDGFTRIAEWVRPERGIREKQVSDYYKALLRKMDSDNSGDLSGEELRQAVNYAELDVRDIAARMVVKHDSEWFGGSSHHRWRTFLKQLDPLCISYVRKWFDDMEWMSQVDEFSSGAPVWHMHPVVFLNALHKSEGDRCKVLFSKVSGVILRHEGGYVNDPDDKGGETNMGITIDTWKAFAPGDLNIPATSKTLKEMTKEQTETIYYNHYWKPKGFCKLENTKIALMIYDWTITSGRAIKQIRKLLHGEYNAKLSINNHMDDDMINCVNDIDNQEQLLNRIADVRKDYYRSLTVTDGKPNAQVKFLKGWINRVDDCLNVSV